MGTLSIISSLCDLLILRSRYTKSIFTFDVDHITHVLSKTDLSKHDTRRLQRNRTTSVKLSDSNVSAHSQRSNRPFRHLPAIFAFCNLKEVESSWPVSCSSHQLPVLFSADKTKESSVKTVHRHDKGNKHSTPSI